MIVRVRGNSKGEGVFCSSKRLFVFRGEERGGGVGVRGKEKEEGRRKQGWEGERIGGAERESTGGRGKRPKERVDESLRERGRKEKEERRTARLNPVEKGVGVGGKSFRSHKWEFPRWPTGTRHSTSVRPSTVPV